MQHRQAHFKFTLHGSNISRGLGLGFGPNNQFPIYLNEPNRGLINNIFAIVPEQLMGSIQLKLKAWIAVEKSVKESFLLESIKPNIPHANIVFLLKEAFKEIAGEKESDLVVKNFLALVIPDVLVDMNVTRLQKILPGILKNIDPTIKRIFEREGLKKLLADEGGKRLIKSLANASIPHTTLPYFIKYLRNMLKVENLHKLNPEILAYLIPAVLDRMDDDNLKQVSYAIAQKLAAKDFRILTDKNYFIPEIKTDAADFVKIRNANERSLQIFVDSKTSLNPNKFRYAVKYRDEMYDFQHFHFHFERDGEEREYEIYKDKKEHNRVKKDPNKNTNKKMIGELHFVFSLPHPAKMIEGSTTINREKLMALGVPLIFGKANTYIDELLTKMKIDEIIGGQILKNKPWSKIDKHPLMGKFNYGKLLAEAFKNPQDLIYHSWGSLKSGAHGFKSGLRFNITPQPLEISEDQYNRLKKVFGTMKTNLRDEDILDPIDRKGGYRKERRKLQDKLYNHFQHIKLQSNVSNKRWEKH